MTTLRTLALGTALAALAACASTPMPGGKSLEAADLGVVASQTSTDGMDPIAKAAFWGTRYDRDPSDTDVSVRFSQALRAVQNEAEAALVRHLGSAAQRAVRI